MSEAYKSDAIAERLRSEEDWREKRRRSFERFVMMPLSFGTFAAFAGVGLTQIYVRIAGETASKPSAMYVGAASAAVAAIGLIANLVTSRTRE